MLKYGEGIIIFGLLPALLYAWPIQAVLFASMAAGALYALWRLPRAVPDFSWRRAWWGQGITRAQLWGLVLRVVAVLLCAVILTFWLAPERLFTLPRDNTALWLRIMLFYPWLSALPQEILYRTFFFAVTARGLSPQRALLLNSAVFAWAHVVFGNPLTLLLSGVAGWLLGRAYQQHQSLLWAFVEHALYGIAVFTAGLGILFYIGAAR